jgi:hypothetical protein
MPIASRRDCSAPAQSPVANFAQPRLFRAWPSIASAPTARAISMARSAHSRLGARRAQYQDLGLGREHARQLGRRRLGRQDAHRVAVGGQGAVAVAGEPQVAAEALAREGAGRDVAGAIGELDRRAA